MRNVRRWLIPVCRVTVDIIAIGVVILAGFGLAGAQEPSGEEEQETMRNTIIHAEVILKGFGDCPVELYVNDIPVTRVGGKYQPYEWVPVPEFLVDGENSLTLVICPGPTPSSATTGPCACGAVADTQMAANARFVRIDAASMAGPDEGETLLELKWSGAAGDSLPKTVTVKGDLGPHLGPWGWQSAEVLTLDDKTRKSATEFINKMRKAYEAADPEPFITNGKIKNADAGRTYPDYADGFFENMVREMLGEMKGDPEWKPSTLSADDYDLRLVAGGRMIEAIAKDWMPILRMTDDNFRLRMLIGRVDGEWQIMR